MDSTTMTIIEPLGRCEYAEPAINRARPAANHRGTTKTSARRRARANRGRAPSSVTTRKPHSALPSDAPHTLSVIAK